MNGPDATVGSISGDPGRATHAARRPLLWEAALAIDIVRPEEAAELRDLLFSQPKARAALAEIVPSGGLAASEAQRLRFAVAGLGALRSCGSRLGPETRAGHVREPPRPPNIPPLPAALNNTPGKQYRQLARDVWLEWPDESSAACREFRPRQLAIARRAVLLRDQMAPGVGLDIAERLWAFTDGAWRRASAALCFEVKQRQLATVVALAVDDSKGLEFTLERVLLAALRTDGRLHDREWDILRRWAADVLRNGRPLSS